MPVPELLTQYLDQFIASMVQPGHVLAIASAALAGLLVIVSAFVRTMIPLRWLAVGSNLGFILYGLLQPVPLMVVLHAVLLPVNLVRVVQMVRLTRRVSAAAADSTQLELGLRPYMRSRSLRVGATIFHLGDKADRMYFLAEGRIELVEFGRTLETGQMFGEIAFFAPDRRRTSTARCVTPCTVFSIDEDTFKQLYFQNPGFGLEIVRLIAGRLSADVRELQAKASMADSKAS